MEYSSTYTVTERIQEQSVKQFFWHVMLTPGRRVRIAGFLIVLFGLSLLDHPYQSVLVGFGVALALFLAISWTKAYVHLLGHARKSLALMDDPAVRISINDSLIAYESSTAARRHRWDKIDGLQETRDFIIIMNGRLPLLSLPKSALSGEVIRFMKEQAGG